MNKKLNKANNKTTKSANNFGSFMKENKREISPNRVDGKER